MQSEIAGGQVARRESLADWLTVERVAYGAIALVALTVRLVGLGWSPLYPAEAMQALPALAAATGRPYDLTGISPLLFSLQRALFMPLGADEVLARWWPALLGGLAALLFYALRDRLTRGGALAAAAAVGGLAAGGLHRTAGAGREPGAAARAGLDGLHQSVRAGDRRAAGGRWTVRRGDAPGEVAVVGGGSGCARSAADRRTGRLHRRVDRAGGGLLVAVGAGHALGGRARNATRRDRGRPRRDHLRLDLLPVDADRLGRRRRSAGRVAARAGTPGG